MAKIILLVEGEVKDGEEMKLLDRVFNMLTTLFQVEIRNIAPREQKKRTNIEKATSSS